MVKFGWDKLKRFLAQANSWTGQQTFSNINVTGGSISGAVIASLPFTTSTNPGTSAATTTAIVNAYSGVIITLSTTGNAQTIGSPTVTTAGKSFTVVNNDTSTNTIAVNGITIPVGKAQTWVWDGTAWLEIDLGITSLPVPVNQGGTGSTTSIIASSISDSDTTHAPDGNSVFDALALKLANLVEDTTPQLGGFLDLNKKYVSITIGLSDQEFCGITVEGTGGAGALAFGELCYFKTADSLWYKAQADVTATSGTPQLGLCVLAGTGVATRMLIFGSIRADSLFDTFTIGAPVYASAATAGKIVSTAPTGTTNFVVRIIGRATTGNEVFVDISPDYIELA
jgi:hypothetical protein